MSILPKRSSAALSLLAATVLVLSACAKEKITPSYATAARVDCGGKQTLKASGSTAQANAMTRFVKAYEKACPGQTVAYTSNGSGAGVGEFLGRPNRLRRLGLAARLEASTTRPSSGAARMPGICRWCSVRWRSPTTSDAVDRLVLDAPTLAKIFNGTITRWDDPAIKALNETMPSEPIHRGIPRRRVGHHRQLPALPRCRLQRRLGQGNRQGVQRRGRPGRPGRRGHVCKVKDTEGAITYNEWSFAQAQRLFAARIVTSAGPDPVAISADTVGKAIAGATIAGQGNDLVFDISSFYKPTQPGAYPIVLATYELVCSKYSDAQTATAVRAFLQSTVGPGQANLEDYGYFPLPDQFQSKVLSAVNAIS